MPSLKLLPERYKPDPSEFEKFDIKTFIINNKGQKEVIEIDLNNNASSTKRGKLRMWFICCEKEDYNLDSVEFIAEVILD